MRSRWLLFLGLSSAAFLSLLPILWMILTALRPKSEIFARDLHILPSHIALENLARAFAIYPVGDWVFNSSLVAIVGGTLTIALDLLAGYAFAKFQFPGRDTLFAVFLGTLMLPVQVLIVPQFMTIAALHGIDTLWAVIVPRAAETYGVFLARQFFRNVPDELLDAARLDGATEWAIFWRIALPLTRAGIAVLALLLVLGEWNDFGWPIVVLQDQQSLTLPVGLSLLRGEHVTDWPVLMTIALVSVVPVALLFLFLQRYFIQGVARTGIK
jgi:alpha-1,4-digalacturonate transport system permease protein